MADEGQHPKYLVVVERAEDGSYSAYVPDLPGCVACGPPTAEQTKRTIREALAVHVEGMREDGEDVPAPTAEGDYVEAPAA
jgi:predicted RNase H-like HicB family nuclease